MKFFAPDLDLRFNAPDDEQADEADEAWEAAIRGYRAHLEGLRDRMPPRVQELAGPCLHDAELLASDWQAELFPATPADRSATRKSSFAIVSVREGDEVLSLIDALDDRVRAHPPREPWPFSGRRTHWLYDEVDLAPGRRGAFLHRVLLSDGTVMEIPFLSVVLHRIPSRAERQGGDPRRIAWTRRLMPG